VISKMRYPVSKIIQHDIYDSNIILIQNCRDNVYKFYV